MFCDISKIIKKICPFHIFFDWNNTGVILIFANSILDWILWIISVIKEFMLGALPKFKHYIHKKIIENISNFFFVFYKFSIFT